MKISNEVKIALVAVAAIVILFFGMNFLKGLTLFSSSNSYYARFNDISGVTVSSPVYANGQRVGVVEKVALTTNILTISWWLWVSTVSCGFPRAPP